MPYLGGIDGIRALAVLAVVAYHLDSSWVPGGFLGVEVFFAVSGYLITALLVREISGSGRIDLIGFWTRRARRLLPTLAATLLTVVVWVSLVDSALVDRVRREALAAVGYLTNWYLILRQESYFEGFGRPSPLRHLWSLAIEEQFYLLWPLLLAAGLALFTQRRLALVVLAGALGSTALMMLRFEPFADPTRVYFGTDTRASGLLLGAALALVWRPWESPSSPYWSRRLGGVGVIALAGLAWLLATLGEFSPRTYQGGFLAVSSLTCLAVAAAAIPGNWFGRLLGWRPLRLVGVRSYALYLVHWPVIVYTRPGIDLDLSGGQVLVIRIALMVALTEAAHRLVEKPIRRRRFSPQSPRWSIPRPQLSESGAVLALGLVVTVAAGASLMTALDRPDEVDPSQPMALASAGSGGRTTGPTVLAEKKSAAAPAEVSAPPVDDQAPHPMGPAEMESALAPLDIEEIRRALALPVIGSADAAEPAEALEASLVLLIGDSVARGADEALHTELGADIIVDAVVSRQFRHTADVLGAYLDEGLDPSTIVVHLGTNGALTDHNIDEVAELVGPDRDLILLTVFVPRPWETLSNSTLTEGAARWCNTRVIDWRTLAADAPDWVGSDGVHLTRTGADAYAHLIATGLSVGEAPDPAAAPTEPLDCE